jgi:hypothetical protein
MVVVVRMVICGGPALTGRIGRHSTARLAVVAAATLMLAQLDQGVGRGHPQLGRERGIGGGPVGKQGPMTWMRPRFWHNANSTANTVPAPAMLPLDHFGRSTLRLAAHRFLAGLPEQLLDREAIRTQVKAPDPAHRPAGHRDDRAPGTSGSPKAAQIQPTAVLPARSTRSANHPPTATASAYLQPRAAPLNPQSHTVAGSRVNRRGKPASRRRHPGQARGAYMIEPNGQSRSSHARTA